MRLLLVLVLVLPLLLGPVPRSSALKVRRQSESWGPWGGWSPCSRTCGGGISFRERPCYSHRRSGGASCLGPARSHRTCHMESCSPRARDFRALQCAEFDGLEFQGRRYTWLPYYGAPNKCELNCIPKGESFYYKHREAVLDGTPCEPGRRDVCVEGRCRRVGCDHRLDSSVQEDVCLKCGGDGTACYPVTGTFDASDLHRGVHYKYHLPLGAPRSGFNWSHGSWSDCSSECGGGHQTRAVFCTMDSEAYPDRVCQLQPRPAARRPCNPHPCPQTKRWKTGPWAPCSASCGGGSQSRSVYCALSDGAGVLEAADEAECAGLPGKPPATQVCNTQRCAAWSVEPWGECSASCGPGIRRRRVTCRGDEGSLLLATACSLGDQPPATESCVRDDCGPLNEQAWHVGAWGLCSKSCSSGTRRRQVVCALGPPGRCASLPLSKPADVEPCNTQPCHLPPDVPSVHTSSSDPWLPLGPEETLASDSGDQLGEPQERPSALGNPRGDQGPHLRAWGPAPSRQPSLHQQPLWPGQKAGDCRHSPHGCCPDGHTASGGPQWQGCPGVPCQQSRYGCCPDGVSAAPGPHQAGCSDGAGRRLGSRAVASAVSQAQQAQAQENESRECRGSRFGCCYDGVAPAAGPLGEGCVGQPGFAYPAGCLLLSAHGSCTDWAARWYFIPSVGRCNRFWYGGCHGNANNFASEEECMSSCRGPGHGPAQPTPGSGQSLHGDGSGSPGGQEAASRPRAGVTQRKPLSPGDVWWRDPQPGPGAPHHTGAWSRELGPSTSRLGGNAGQHGPPAHSSSYRISLAGAGPSLVQAALGQLVQLYCPGDNPLDFRAAWLKDGQPVSSGRHQQQLDGSLVISPLWAEDAGTYSCGSARPGRDSQIQLHVTGADGADVAVSSEAEPRHFPQTGDPAQGHGAQYSGLAGDTSPHPRRMTRLHLDHSQPGVVDAHPGQRVRLPCRAEGFPPPTIEWQRDGQLLSAPRHQLQPDGSLVVSQVTAEDSGFYACVAFNGHDRDQRWVQLRVLGELTITGLPSTVTVPEGDTARLLCMVAGQSVNVRWSRNGLPVQADGRRVHQSPDGTLLIHNLRARDEGSYTCSAYRGSQAVSRSTEVKMTRPALATQPRDPRRECTDQPELANCDLVLQAGLCGNEYYSSFCCASCSRVQPPAQPIWQQG
ncbi:PREDICTED: papilin [Condylura cristata]|uniref:papilin n=1 Tax=Condylura cristata TaxID=143302 RepID=UPI0006428C80|nr:PREDICTED: papilin [Condylura cristata]